MANFIQRLFGIKDRQEEREKATDSGPIQEETAFAPEARPVEPSQLIAACGQSVGRQRDHNEDSLFSFSQIIAGDTGVVPVGVYIIADGMGGHQHGEQASDIAIRTMAECLVRRLVLPTLDLSARTQPEPLHEVMQSGVFEAQQAVLHQVPGGGTTLTAAYVMGDQVTLAHVGDSRAYFIQSDGKIEAITRDHSLVRRLQELGQLTEKEALVHPQRNVLYRAIGQGEPFEADVSSHPFPPGGYLLICSDGLWGLVPDEEMQTIVLHSPTLESACQAMVVAANEAGGPDNISVILVHLPG